MTNWTKVRGAVTRLHHFRYVTIGTSQKRNTWEEEVAIMCIYISDTDKKMKLFEDETELPSVDESAVCIHQQFICYSDSFIYL